MTSSVSASPAVEWASTVSARAYPRSRHVLDELIVDTVPAYAAIVDEELDRFEKSAVEARVRLDAPYQASWSIGPAMDDVRGLLTAVVIVSIAISFGLAFPGGSRIGVSVPTEWRHAMTTASSAAFVVAVVAQLARLAPYVRHVPPRDNSAWPTLVFGVPVIVFLYGMQQQDIGIPPGAVIVAFVALLVSTVGCLARLARRRRDPRLTKKVDAAAKGRTTALRKAVIALADDRALRLVERFASIPDDDRSRLIDELTRAAETLEARGLARPPRTRGDGPPRNRRTSRGLFPGFLLLSHRVETVDSRTGGTAQWIVGDYLDDPVP
jgi:hypothetical protein